MQNRRKHTRVPMRAQVTCIVDSQTFRGVSRDLSHGGIQVEMPELQTADIVQLMFRIPVSQALVDAIGAVVWTTERRHGIRFNSLGGHSQQSIWKFIEESQLT